MIKNETIELLLTALLKNEICADHAESEDIYNGELVMAFLNKGFIFVGNLYSEKNGMCRLENARNCRSQEKGAGWGYIAKIGPSGCTIDDYTSNPIRFNSEQIIFTQELDKKIWK